MLKSITLILLALSVTGLSIASLAGFLGAENIGTYAWIFDLFNHFRLQYFIGLLLVLLVLLLFRSAQPGPLKYFRSILIAISIIFLLVNGAFILPYYLPQPKHGPITARIRIFHANVWNKNHNSQLVINAVRAANADILNFQEYNTRWRTTLEKSDVLKAYPYRYHISGGDDAIYSKIPFTEVRAEHIPGSTHGADVAIVANFNLSGRPVTLLFSHPPIPIKPDQYIRLKQHYAFWASNRKAYLPNWAIIGDLNSTAWSHPFQQLLQRTGLRDSQLGFGIQPSFPTYNLLKRVSIDHCLVSKNFIVLNRQIGPSVDSDHFPLIIDLGLQ